MSTYRYPWPDLDPLYCGTRLVGFTQWDPRAFKSVPVDPIVERKAMIRHQAARDEVPCGVCDGAQRDWPSCRLECCPHRPIYTNTVA